MPLNPSPRKRHERRAEQIRNQVGPQEIQVREDKDSNEPQSSCDLDDDDNTPFSKGIMNVPILNDFTLPKIPKYDGRCDPTKHLNSFKTHMSLRRAISAMQCRVFHLTLRGVVEVWYTRLQEKSIQNLPNFKKAFLKRIVTRKEGERPIQRLQDMSQQ